MPAILRALLPLCVVLASAASLAAEEPSWGHLKAQFIYNGKPPEATPLKVDKDHAVCAKDKLLEEWLVVHPKNHGVANVVCWLELQKGQELPPEHPDYAAAAKKEVVLRMEKCRIEPHVCLLRTKQLLLVKNIDPVEHNEKIDVIENGGGLSPLIPPGGPTRKFVFAKAESLPSNVSCSIHSWMRGFLLVKDHPYMAVSNADGQLEIRNLPPGNWTFVAWHETGWLKGVERDGKPMQWHRGRFQVEVTPGENDLGQFKLNPELFKKR